VEAVYNNVAVEARRYTKKEVETREHTARFGLYPDDIRQDMVAFPQHDVFLAALDRVFVAFHDSLDREEQKAGAGVAALHEYLTDNNIRLVE